MVGAVGIEPTTFGLKGRCSTAELRPCCHQPVVFIRTYLVCRCNIVRAMAAFRKCGSSTSEVGSNEVRSWSRDRKWPVYATASKRERFRFQV